MRIMHFKVVLAAIFIKININNRKIRPYRGAGGGGCHFKMVRLFSTQAVNLNSTDNYSNSNFHLGNLYPTTVSIVIWI